MLKRLLAGLLFGMGIVSFLGWWQWQRIRKNRLSAPLASSLIRHPDSDIILQRNGDTLSVRWAKQTSKADIFLSEAFSENIPPQAVTTVENQQLAILHGIDTQKRYQVTVKCDDGTELRQIERVLPFGSVPNFRDIGGYSTKDGRTVRWNRVYRASALDNLSQQDSERLRDLDVKLVCDVRIREEQATNPDNLPDNIRLISTAPSSDYVRQKYSSVENYFHSYLGLSAETLNAIRYNLLD